MATMTIMTDIMIDQRIVDIMTTAISDHMMKLIGKYSEFKF